MSVKTAPTYLSYDEALKVLPPESRGEILDGVWTVTPSPNLLHQHVSKWLTYAFTRYEREHPERGWMLYAPTDVVLRAEGRARVVQPDILFVDSSRREIMKPGAVIGAPTLVVEIVSAGGARHDTIRKRAWYAEHGVREYWLVWPEEKSITVLHGEGLIEAVEYEAEDTLETSLLPDLRIPLVTLFTPPWESPT